MNIKDFSTHNDRSASPLKNVRGEMAVILET